MRFRWMLALAAVFTFGGAGSAQEAKPTVEVRLRSVNELTDKAEYIAGLANQEEAVKQLRQIIKALSADGKGIEGIDPKKPFGLTATLAGDVVSSPFLVMVPIADQERFLGMLENRANITTKKDENGTLKASVPVINEVYLRFTNDYVYIARTVKDLDPKTLPTPKAFFAKDDGSVGSVLVRFESIPAELKTFVIGQLELGIAEQRKKSGMKEAVAQKVILDFLGDNATSAIKTLLDDAKELQVRVFIDEKADDLSGEITLTSKSGSTLAKNISNLAGKTSIPAAIVGGGKDSVVRFAAKAALPEGVKKDLDKVVDAAFQEILKGAGDNEMVERGLKLLAPTLKAGEIDVAVAFNGPDSKGNHTLIAAAGVKGGKDLEKFVKDLVKQFGPFVENEVKFELDVEKIGNYSLHTVTLKNVPAEVEKIFGTGKVWVAVSDDVIALSIEPEGTALKAGLKAKPVAASVLSVDVAFAKLVPIVGQNLKPDELKAMLKDAFGNESPTGKDTLSITITGGNELTVKGKLKGKGIRLLTTLDQFKIK